MSLLLRGECFKVSLGTRFELIRKGMRLGKRGNLAWSSFHVLDAENSHSPSRSYAIGYRPVRASREH